MSQLLIRNLDSHVMNQLKKIAKLHHRSLQGEIKFIRNYSPIAPDPIVNVTVCEPACGFSSNFNQP